MAPSELRAMARQIAARACWMRWPGVSAVLYWCALCVGMLKAKLLVRRSGGRPEQFG